MFQVLEEINTRPAPFAYYTADTLWTDEHISKKMLEYHLSQDVEAASRKFEFIDRSVAWIVSHFGLGPLTRVADFGCGPGLYTLRLAKRGAAVTGIDFSANSLAYARQAAADAGLEIEYIHRNYLEFETGERYDLITLIYCDYCALSPQQRETLLGKFHRFLKPGGSVLLDVHSLAYFHQKEESQSYARNWLDHFWSPNPYYSFMTTFKYEAEKISLDKHTIIEADRRRVIYNWLQHFDPDSLRAEFEAAGFEVQAFFGDVAGAAYDQNGRDFAIVGKR